MLSMKERAARTRSTLGLAGFLLVLVVTLGAPGGSSLLQAPGPQTRFYGALGRFSWPGRT